MCVPFRSTFKKKSDKVLAFVILVLIAAVVGGSFSMIPVIISPIVNYMGIPLYVEIIRKQIDIQPKNKEDNK